MFEGQVNPIRGHNAPGLGQMANQASVKHEVPVSLDDYGNQTLRMMIAEEEQRIFERMSEVEQLKVAFAGRLDSVKRKDLRGLMRIL